MLDPFLYLQITVLSNSGTDTSEAFPAVAKLLASNDFIIKKLAYWFVSDNADNTDLILLIINTLLKDCEDPNPMMRGLALKTLTNLPVATVLDYCIQPITRSLGDKSAFVRRASVVATVRVHTCQPAAVMEAGWIDMLYKMIRDPDPLVVTNCLYALSTILEKEGGIVVNRNMAHYLLNRIDQFSDYHIVYVIRTLNRYKPLTEDETLDIMNVMDSFLKSDFPCVVLEALDYFLFLINNMPHLKGELFKRVSKHIHHLLESHNSEVVYTLMEHVQDLVKNGMQLSRYYKVFFCKYNEPTYVKIKKIDILSLLANASNVEEILEELRMYCLDVSVTKASIYTISTIAHNHPEHRSTTISSLLHLLELHPEDVAEVIFKVLQTLDLGDAENLGNALMTIQKASGVLETESGKAAFVSLLGRYAEHIDSAPYVLEDYIRQAVDGASSEMLMSLLTAGMQLVLKRPAECQHMFSMLLEHCLTEGDICVRDKALFYYHLLWCSPTGSIKVMNIKSRGIQWNNKSL